MQKLPNLAHFRRYIWEKHSLLVVIGNIGRVIEGARVYNTRHAISSADPVDNELLLRLLAATGLAAISLAERETWGWTCTVPDSSLGFFVGIEPEGMICFKFQEADHKRRVAVVQRQHPDEPLKESHFEAPDADPVHMVQRYFEEVVQLPTSIAVDESGNGILVQNLPGGNIGEILDLSEQQLIECVHQAQQQKELKELAEVLLFYECRCHEEMIMDMIENLPQERQDELWGELGELEIECPRCGREYLIKKKTIH